MTIRNKIIISFIILILLLVIPLQNYFFKNDKNKLTTFKIQVENCLPQNNQCEAAIDNLKIKVSFDKDVFYLKPFKVSVLQEDNSGFEINSIYIDFKMKKMDMGVNRFLLTNIESKNVKRHWEGKALLPVCVTGRADWVSEIEVISNTKKYIFSFPLMVKRATN